MALNHRGSPPKGSPSPRPPPLPPRPGVDQTESPLQEDLRKIYEDGEIRRFLHVFSSYVSEVKALDTPHTPATKETLVPWLEREGHDEDSFAKLIAETYVEPNLPPVRQVVPTFTLGRARLTTQRLYLACQTFYLPFLQSAYDLARWKDYRRSLVHCSLFWILWWHDMVLPALILWPIIISFRRRMQPYPVGQQLQDYQEQIAMADDFSDKVSESLASPSSALDMGELWRLVKFANRTLKTRPHKIKSPKSALSPAASTTSVNENETPDVTSPGPPLVEEQKEEQELQDLKTIGLFWLTAAADLHERVHNIFVWRNPAVSFRYIMALLGIFCFILFVPTRYIAKSFWFAMGSLFWHVVPVLDALPSDACSRLPPLFADCPTDADYAMQLISQRVAAGQDILPPAPPSKIHFRHRSEDPKTGKPFIPKSLGEIGKLMGEEARRITRAASDVREGRPITSGVHPLVSNALSIVIPEVNPDVYTYMCQFGSTPGLITLTLKRLYVTPMFSGSSKEEIPVEDISGVKKTGLLKGLRISWMKTEEGHSKEEEFKFSWVANRDDLFARLVGLGKQRWKSV